MSGVYSNIITCGGVTPEDWTLIEELTPTGDSQYLEMNFDINNYNSFLVEGTLNLSNSDWVYFQSGKDRPATEHFIGYYNTAQISLTLSRENYPYLFLERTSGTTFRGFLWQDGGWRIYNYDLSLPQYFYTYNGHQILSSSNVKIYGKTTLI